MNRIVSSLLLTLSTLVAVGCGSDRAVEDGPIDKSQAALVALEYDETHSISGSSFTVDCFLWTDYAQGGFRTTTDTFRLQDKSADGERVAIYWELHDSALFTKVVRRGLVVDKLGKAGGDTAADFNFGGNKALEMKLGRCNGTTSDCRNVGDFTWNDAFDGCVTD